MAKALSGRNNQVFRSLGGRVAIHGWKTCVEVFQWPWMTVLVLERDSTREFSCICQIQGANSNRSIRFKGATTSLRSPECRELSTVPNFEEAAADQSARIDRRWHKYFTDPSLWYDNRASKKSSTDPDFEHTTTRERLWIENPWTPPWVRSKLIENWRHGWSIYSGVSHAKQSEAALPDESIASFQLAGAKQECVREAEKLKWLMEEGCLVEALEKLEDLDLKSLHDPVGVYSFLIRDCCNMKALDEGRRLYAHIMDSEYASSSSLGLALMDMFVKCRSISDARRAFDRLPRQDVSSWNTFLLCLVNHGYDEEGIELFEELMEKGLLPNRQTFVSVLRACISLSALSEGKLIHALILESGLESDCAVGKALVHMYLKLGNREDAYEVFMKLSLRDVVTYNALIQRLVKESDVDRALMLVGQMRQEGLNPDAVTFMNILKGCGSLGALELGQLLHDQAIKSSTNLDLLLATTLVDMYAKCRKMEDACKVFAGMATRDVVAWNAFIAGYSRYGSSEEALSLFSKMQQEGVEPNKVTYITVLKACSNPIYLEHAKQFHAKVLQAGSELDLALGTALLDAYVQCGSLTEALQVFENMPKDQLVVWNTMLEGYVQAGQSQEAIRLFQQLLMEGLMLDEATFIAVLKASADLAALEWGRVIASYINEYRYEATNSVIGTTLVDMYFNCGSIDDACKIFEKLLVRDVVAWDTMIAGYARFGDNEAALRIFRQMQEEGVQPDEVTFSRVLNACADSANLEEGKRAHLQARAQGLDAAAVVGNSLIDMYAKCGSLDTALDVFRTIPERTLVSWNAMLAGYAQHGQGAEALKLFQQMQADGVNPNSYTYVSVLSACSHAGLVEEGLQYFKSMTEHHKIEPSMQHYSCVVDLLGRAGRLEEAEAVVEQMPFQPDAVIWLSLLAASKRYSNLEVGKRAFDHVLRLQPENDAAYVLLGQLFESANRWDDVAEVKSQMKVSGVKRQVGYSWVAANREVHAFLPGDISHPEYKKIYAALHRVLEMAKKVGYRSPPVSSNKDVGRAGLPRLVQEGHLAYA